MNIIFSLFTLFLLSAAATAQPVTDEDRFYRLERTSLEKLLDTETSVASRIPVELRKTPGIVTVITREDIELAGARNLVDLPRRIPDFEFVSDVQGNIGLSVRGNSAIEGKVRVLWDGQTYNEALYGTVQFDRFPVDQIERIEIIKGPGSVIYGGLGEMAILSTGATRIKFPVYSLEGKGSVAAGADLRLEPIISFQYSKPWNENDEHFPYDKAVRHYTGGLTAFYGPDAPLGVMAGAEFEREDIKVGARTSADASYGGGRGRHFPGL
ncbi:MAG: TonB-dependent receptor plug [Elusimicrobia bacterium]|nr:MAG: TonB-dependent receptor plug [Elusimicrobiota bacterium]KAF0154102.1 MAG: TonB-dependent receptor plug [Elusimicrobiota bacterium]